VNIELIEKYTVFTKDITNKKSSKFVIEGNYPQDVHKIAFNRISNFQEIEKIVDALGNEVYNLKDGFKY